MPAESYRIILGDMCTICRAVSRITFPVNRPPQLPIAGCRDPGGCRCRLPILLPAAEAEVTEPTVPAAEAAPQPPQEVEHAALAAAPAEPAPLTPASLPATAPPESDTPPRPAAPPDWSQPAPITQRRRNALADLKELHRKQRIQGIRIVTAGGCCDVCAEVAASIYDPSIAPPLPVVGCASGWQCRCQYAEVPLPLDERGLRAMERLEGLERERALRRAGVALGGPRALHYSVMVAALAIAIASLWWAGTSGSARLWPVPASIVFAGISAVVALLAVRRQRRIPPPPWTYVVCGLGAALVALGPLWGLQLPPGLDIQHLGRLSSLAVTPSLSADTLERLPRAQQAVAATGVVLFALGLFDWMMTAGGDGR
ncbi:MAG TPA: hypothetical protein VK821_06195 [Dehalococcoidia bacterium]|nr:hypothetical protein [Dehalococcoidia bacterium]